MGGPLLDTNACLLACSAPCSVPHAARHAPPRACLQSLPQRAGAAHLGSIGGGIRAAAAGAARRRRRQQHRLAAALHCTIAATSRDAVHSSHCAAEVRGMSVLCVVCVVCGKGRCAGS